MATLADIGIPGQPLGTPPLTAWQAAVRDALTPLVSTMGALTPRAGWADYGSSYAGMFATKQGRVVTIDAMFKPTADTALTVSSVTLADVPAGWRPTRDVIAPVVYKLTTGFPAFGAVTITTAGAVIFGPGANGTILAASGYVSLNLSYRCP